MTSRPLSPLSRPGSATPDHLASRRLPLVDLLRGLAIVQMIAYHFIYDLTYFGWLHLQMTEEAPWIAWRDAIVTQFLLVVGIGVVLADAGGRPGARFWRRWAQIAGAALLVSAATAVMFGPRFIWFGILHFVALALLLARPLPRLGPWNLALGALLLALAAALQDARFDPPWIAWIGFTAHKPPTEDYVPVVPWFGVVAIGIGLADGWRRLGFRVPPPLQRLDASPVRLLRWLGQWPLTVYLVHQPILMAILTVVKMALPA